MTPRFPVEGLTRVLREFNGGGWADSLELGSLMSSAQEHDLVPSIGIVQLYDTGHAKDHFLVLLDVSPKVTVCSTAVDWEDVRPATEEASAVAIEHVLTRLCEIARRLESDFDAEVSARRDG